MDGQYVGYCFYGDIRGNNGFLAKEVVNKYLEKIFGFKYQFKLYA